VQFHVIYTETDVLLSRREYASWREIQDEYQAYKASLGPWDRRSLVDYLTKEYPLLFPPAEEQLDALVSGREDTVTLTFREPPAHLGG
jgi:hypothetical protein